MSRTRLLTWIAALLSALVPICGAKAEKLPHISGRYLPSDYQFFAPVESDEYDGAPPPKSGFFFQYERMYLNMSRPETEASDGFSNPGDFQNGGPITQTSFWDGDWTWGNRYEFGFMSEDSKGWLCTVMHVDGPNETFPLLQESLNRWVQGPLEDGTVLIPEFHTWDPSILQLQNSLNVADYTSVTIERIIRKHSFHHGGILETLVGSRFMRYNDYYQRDSFPLGSSFGRFTDSPDNFPLLVDPDGEGPWEVIQHRVTQTENFMLGGQLGLRYFYRVGHWRGTVEVRAFACQNWVNQVTTRDTWNLRWDTIGDAEEPGTGQDLILTQRQPPEFNRASEFCFGGEVRGQACYSLTRDISLQVGFTFVNLGKGIARGANLDRSHQDVQMGSVDFGFAWNR